MIDDQRKAVFKGQLEHYAVCLRMRQGSLLIQAEDKETLHKYSKVVNSSYLEQQDIFFKAYFESPLDIFNHIVEHFPQVVVQKDLLRFFYMIGAKKQTKEARIELIKVKEEVGDIELAHIKVGKLREHVTIQLLEKDKRISQLQKGFRELAEDVKQYKQQDAFVKQRKRDQIETFLWKILQRDAKIKLLEEKTTNLEESLLKLTQILTNIENKGEKETARLDAEIRKLSACLIKEQESNKNLQEQLIREAQKNVLLEQKSKHVQQKLKKEEERSKALQEKLRIEEKRVLMLQKDQNNNNASTAKRVQNINKNYKYCEKPIDFMLISNHLANSYSKYYFITNFTACSAKLVKRGGGQNMSYNFVNKTEVLPNQHNKYGLRIVKTKYNQLYVGFCTQIGLGAIRSYDKVESAYYFCGGYGCLFEDGICKNLSASGCKDGDLLECVADLSSRRFSWSKDGKVITDCPIPASMKGKSVYFSIVLRYEGQTVQIRLIE